MKIVKECFNLTNFSKLWFSLGSLFPLVDFLVIRGKLPYATILFWIVILLFKTTNSKVDIVLLLLNSFFIGSILVNIIIHGWVQEYLLSLFIILVTSFGVYILPYIEDSYYFLRNFIYVYFSISILIYAYRLILYNMDFYRVRGGAVFYGGNSAQLLFLLFMVIASVEEKKKDIVILIIITTINALLFVSRGAILLEACLIAYFFIKKGILNNSVKVFLIVLFGIFFFGISSVGIIDVVITRMHHFRGYVNAGHSILGTRGLIFSETINYLKMHIDTFILGCGTGKYKYLNSWGYTNPHNILLDIWISAGAVALVLFLYMIMRIIKKLPEKILFIMSLIYAILEGISMFYVDTETNLTWGFVYMFFCYIYIKYAKYDTREKKLNV